MAATYDSFQTSLTTNTNPLAWSVTIPSGTTCVVLCASGYTESGLDPLTSVDLNGTNNFTVATNHHREDTYADVGIAYLFNPSTGSQTINISYSSIDYEMRFYAVYVTSCATDGLRDSDEATGYSLTLTTAVDDLVVVTACLGAGGACDWTNATERHEDQNGFGVTFAFATLTADGTSETISCSDNYTAITAIVLKSAGEASSTASSIPKIMNYLRQMRGN